MTVKTPIESILALAASVFDAYSVVLFEAPREGRSQIIAAYTQGDHIDQDAVIAPGRGIVGWILRNSAPLVMNSLESSQTSLGYYQEDWLPEIGSFLGCPLPEGGVLCVDSLRRHAFPQEKQNLIAVFAEIVAQVLTMDGQNGGSDSGGAFLLALDRLAELRRRYSGWKNYIARLLGILVENSGFEYAAFSSRPEGSPKYIVEGESPQLLLKDGKPMELSVHSGIVGWVFRNEEPLYNDGRAGSTPLYGKMDGVPEFGAAVCVPVIMDKTACGVLCLASGEKKPIPEELRAFMRLAADDLGQMLEALSLRYRMRTMEKASKRN
ncbi:GAF domain-containing protein [Mailhella sp.]|uniref:GAF domain-containing protein n=1 Tax=Mailhella sp. TaxID=1981029 RepID=UPI0040643FB7